MKNDITEYKTHGAIDLSLFTLCVGFEYKIIENQKKSQKKFPLSARNFPITTKGFPYLASKVSRNRV